MRFESTLWTVIDGARAGDPDALRTFVARYRAPVIAYCVRRGFAADAEDLAQEVFIRLFEHGVLLKADPSKGRFRSLLFAVTRHAIGHHVERATAVKRGGGKIQALGDLDIAQADDGDPEFDREWVAHLLTRALERLALSHPNYHDALRRFVLEGNSYAEIAAATGQPASELKNHIHRGKRKLLDYLRDEVREYAADRDEYAAELALLSRYLPE